MGEGHITALTSFVLRSPHVFPAPWLPSSFLTAAELILANCISQEFTSASDMRADKGLRALVGVHIFLQGPLQDLGTLGGFKGVNSLMANFSSVVGSEWGQCPLQITKSHHVGDFLLSRACLPHSCISFPSSIESCLNVHTCSCKWGLSLARTPVPASGRTTLLLLAQP